MSLGYGRWWRRLAIAGALAAVSMSASAQSGAGARYATRDPMACPAGVGNTLSPTQAAQLVSCTMEAPGTLYDGVKVQLGAARNAQSVDSYPDLDPGKPVYPIRASFAIYTCADLVSYPGAAPNNCSVHDVTDAAGLCFRTTFGDWRCKTRPAANTVMRPNKVPGPR